MGERGREERGVELRMGGIGREEWSGTYPCRGNLPVRRLRCRLVGLFLRSWLLSAFVGW